MERFTDLPMPWLQASWTLLSDTLDRGQLGHAMLIHGPAGLGKRALAARLLARLLCQQPSGDACGQCHSCRLLSASRHQKSSDGEVGISTHHPDLVAVMPAAEEQIKVDEIREITHRLSLTPSIGSHRAALIHNAERMNESAANALLKTLEEPSAGTWLVLVCDCPARLKATVRSRCLALTVRPPATAQALEWLAQHTTDADPQQCQTALQLAGGAPLTAFEWLSDGHLAFAEEILRGLVEEKHSPVHLAEQWAERAPETWRWLARWCAAALRLALLPGSRDANNSRLAPLTVRSHNVLQAQYDQACRGLRLSATPVRQDLLLCDWLIQWRRSDHGS